MQITKKGRWMNLGRTAVFALVCTFGLGGGALLGCGSADETAEAETHKVVPPGKADDFYSATAQEFSARGTSTVTIEDDYADATDAEKLERARALADAKTAIIAIYLNYYVVDKSSHSRIPEYGGYHAMARAASFAPETVEWVEGLTYTFEFRGEVGAALDFLDQIPTVDNPDIQVPAEAKILRLRIPAMEASDVTGGWKSQYNWSPSSFDPDAYAGELETLDLITTPIEISGDGYLDYGRLLEDGKLEIGVHFGYDYNDARYDISEARQLFNQLKTWDFAAPVETFEALAVDSAPFTKTVAADGRSIEISLKLVHADMVDPAAEGAILKQSLVESLETREVIFFNGHAGFSGRLLPGNWQASSAGVISPAEFAELNMPTDFQIVVVNGCDTYAKFADGFRTNPAKHDANDKLANIAVVTTTSFSWLSQMSEVTEDLLKALTGGDEDEIEVATWDDVLTDISWGRNADVFFGVHGIDGAPRLHPFADVELLCSPCRSDADCGGAGNMCVELTDGNRYCTPSCLDDSGCPEDTVCQEVATGSWITDKQCVPVDFSCSSEPVETAKVLINEVLADPAPDASGDANGDGERSYTEDEFVEIYNASDTAVDLSGWTVADSYDVRFVFPQGVQLAPYSALVVFGGGNPASFHLPDAESVPVLAAATGLGISNSGDSIFLSDSTGAPIDSVSFGGEAGNDRALTRAVDGDAESALIPHPGDRAHSPGTRQDGTPF